MCKRWTDRLTGGVLGWLALCALAFTAGCNLLSRNAQTARVGVCARTITPQDLGMQIEAVSQLPFVTREGAQIRVEIMGSKRAQAYAEDLLSGTTVCTEPLPESVATVLQQARETLQAGDQAGALEIIRTLLGQTSSGVRPLGLMRVRAQTHADWRARIGATIQFAEELALQGDQAAYDNLMQEVGEYFDQQASAALEEAGFDETLRIAEDALLLGRDRVFQQASNRLKDAARQELEEAIKDFDPCLPNPDVLENSIKDLLNALAKAQFFGAADGTGLSEQASALAEQGIANLESLARGEQPACALGGTFSLDGASGFAQATGTLHSCQGMGGPWEGTLQLTYNDGEGIGICSGNATWSFSLEDGELDFRQK